jgi:membrane-associated protein
MVSYYINDIDTRGDNCLNTFLISALHGYGYPALWFIVFIAAIGAPISGNLLLYAAGAFAAFGDFNIFIVFFVAVSAAVMGDNVGYFIGWKVGPPLLLWLERQRRWRFITPRSLERGRVFFRRRAGWAIFITRFLIVVLGGPVNWLAGIERYHYRSFLFWDIAGQILGAIIPLAIGYSFAESWSEAESIFGALSGFLLAFLTALMIFIWVLHKVRSYKEQGEEEQKTHDKQEASEADARPTILILIARCGGGHLNLAQALRDLLEPRYRVVIVDPQAKIVEWLYAFLSRRWLALLHWQFVCTDNSRAARWQQHVLALLNRERIVQTLEQVRPQLIITTHAMVSYAAARANESLETPVPLVFQLTDLECVHMTWFVEKHATAYLVPTREIFAQALAQGIAQERLYLTGRPIRRQFLEVKSADREKTLISLGFAASRFTIFLQGGAEGSAHVDRLIKTIQAMGMQIQIMLAAGKNKKMVARYANHQQVRVIPFTENIALYMAAADIVVGKAGASFISEAFMLEKPFLVTTIIPAQEAPGLRFIERYNLGWVCLTAEAQQELLIKIANNADMIAEKVRSIRAYKEWNMHVYQEVVPIIDHLLSPEKDCLPIPILPDQEA